MEQSSDSVFNYIVLPSTMAKEKRRGAESRTTVLLHESSSSSRGSPSAQVTHTSREGGERGNETAILLAPRLFSKATWEEEEERRESSKQNDAPRRRMRMRRRKRKIWLRDMWRRWNTFRL